MPALKSNMGGIYLQMYRRVHAAVQRLMVPDGSGASPLAGLAWTRDDLKTDVVAAWGSDLSKALPFVLQTPLGTPRTVRNQDFLHLLPRPPLVLLTEYPVLSGPSGQPKPFHPCNHH
jgi:hypothetical protein